MSKIDRYLKPVLKNGRFEIPWSTEQRPSFFDFFWATHWTEKKKAPPTKDQLQSSELMKMLPLNQEHIRNPCVGILQCTWLGHAGFLAQMQNFNILFDPVFSDNIGPIPVLGKYFTPRYRSSPCNVADLPEIDMVCISHDHYDHLDVQTVVDLHKAFRNINWCVPLGFKRWLQNTINTNNIWEFNWWQDEHFTKEKSADSEKGITVSFVPSQHWCKRNATDDNERLWGGWVVSSSVGKVYHAGDTGYCDIFKSIGEKYGPVDVALLPIGNYKPRSVTKLQHISPAEAVKIHGDVLAKKSIAMHWGTFALGTTEDHFEPPQLLKEELVKANISESDFIILKHGETFSLDA